MKRGIVRVVLMLLALLLGAEVRAATASFVRNDASTQGNWQGVYGADGYAIALEGQSYPSYVSNIAVTGAATYSWGPSTSANATQKIGSTTDRIANAWYADLTVTFDIAINDGQTHTLALYMADYDDYGGSRAQTIEMRDTATNALLDSRSYSNFKAGVWGVWRVSGPVTIRLINTNGSSNAVLSGIFFGTAPPAALVAEYRFEEAGWSGVAGEVTDSSGNGHHGTVTGSPVPTALVAAPALAGAPGTCGYAGLSGPTTNGGAFAFPGLPLSQSAGAKNSVSFWMYWDGTDEVMPIGFDRYDLIVALGSIGFNTGNGDLYGTSSAGLANGWHHIAAVFQNGNVTGNKLYIDGVQKTLSPAFGSQNVNEAHVTSNLRVGGWTLQNGYRFAGRIDEVRVYQGALTPLDVSAAMAATHSCGLALVAEYHFEDAVWNGTSGEVKDSSGHGYHGSAIGSPLPTPARTSPTLAGDPGSCGYASLQGPGIGGGAFELPNLPVSTTPGAKTSVSFWMYWDGGDSVMPIGWNHYDLWFYQGSFGFNSANTDIQGISSAGLANGWHHVAAIFTNGSYASNQLYIDGVEQTLTQRRAAGMHPNPSFLVVQSTLRVGGWTVDAENRFSGRIDDLRIYNGAMSAADVAAAKAARHNCGSAALVAEYRFEEGGWNGTAGEVKDSSGNGYHAIAVGSPLPTAAAAAPAVPGSSGSCAYAVLSGPATNGGAFAFSGLPLSSTPGGLTSVAFWMYWDGTDAVMPLGFDAYDLFIYTGRLGFNTSNGDIFGTDITALANGWHHVAAIFTNGSVTSNVIYIDGVPRPLTANGVAAQGNAFASAQLRVGGWTSNTEYRFSGRIDELRVYNGAVNAYDVAQAMAARHACGGGATLIAEYRFEESSWNGTSAEVKDSSGNGHHGKAIGTPLPTPATASPALAGDPGSCGYASGMGPFANGGAFDFDNLPVSTAPGAKTSVAFWMYWDGNATSLPLGWALYNLQLYQGGLFGFDTGVADFFAAPTPALANAWHHIVAVFNNGDVSQSSIYVDGVRLTLTQYGSPNVAGSYVGPTLRVGGWLGDTNFRYSGRIDDVRVYNGELNAYDILLAITARHPCSGGVIAPGGFNAFEAATAAGSISGVIHTKVAGGAFSVDVVALDSARTSVLTSFTGGVKVEFLDAHDNSGALDATTGCRASWTPVTSGASGTLTFAAPDSGRKAISLSEAEAWREVRLRISTPASGTATTVACSSDNFAIRPSSFASFAVTDATSATAGTGRSLANVGASGGIVHKAGRPFTLGATAVNAAGTKTANYVGTPAKTLTACTGTACIGTAGALTATPTAVAGLIDASASYSEVGSFALQLNDSTFASVDAADGSSQSEQTISSAVINVGRFVPDHFDLALLAAPVLKTFNNNTSCALRSFTYLGQPFGYATPPQASVMARNAAGATTANYSGALWKLLPADMAQTYTPTPASPALNAAITAPSLRSLDNGTGVVLGAAGDRLSFVRPSAAPLPAPFDANIALAWTATDSSEAGVGGNGSITTPAPLSFANMAFDAGAQMRFGVLRMMPAYGSELIDLPVQLEAQYWDGARMTTNAADHCTAFATTAAAMSNYQKNLAACETAIAATTTTLTNGRGYLRLKKPGNGNNGSVDLTLQLGAAPSGLTCTALGGAATAATAASLPWLQGKWTNATAFDQNPVTRATFGQYRSPLIYMREMY